MTNQCPATYVTRDGNTVSCNAYLDYTHNNTQQKCPSCGWTRVVVKKEIKPL